MSDKVNIFLCILWEGELRTAARLLDALQHAPTDEYPQCAVAALNACLVALHGLTDEKVAVMLSADTVKLAAPRAARKGTK